MAHTFRCFVDHVVDVCLYFRANYIYEQYIYEQYILPTGMPGLPFCLSEHILLLLYSPTLDTVYLTIIL